MLTAKEWNTVSRIQCFHLGGNRGRLVSEMYTVWLFSARFQPTNFKKIYFRTGLVSENSFYKYFVLSRQYVLAEKSVSVQNP
jgi:hypothetical protein